MLDWVPLTVRPPTKEDADVYGCVLCFDQLNGVKITGWRNTLELGRRYVTHWARIPGGPNERLGLSAATARPVGIYDDGHVGYDVPQVEVFVNMDVLSKLRDEMAANAKNQSIQHIGDFLTGYVQTHPASAAKLMAEGKSITGALKALEDYAKKQPRTGNCAVVDPDTAFREVLRYYGIDGQPVAAPAPATTLDGALDLDALLNL